MRELVVTNVETKTFTYQTRIKEVDSRLLAFLQDYAALHGLVERKLFADFSRGKNIFKLKNEYLSRFGIFRQKTFGWKLNLASF